VPASFSSSARRAGAGRPSGSGRRARVNTKQQRVCVRERVYSFLKRDVVRRIEEQSSLLAVSSLPTEPLLPFFLSKTSFLFVPFLVSTSSLVASSPPAVAKQSKGVSRARLQESFELACGLLDCASLLSVCTCVCVPRQERIKLVFRSCGGYEKRLCCLPVCPVTPVWSPLGMQPAIGTGLSPGDIPFPWGGFTVSLTFPRVFAQRRRGSGGCGCCYPPLPAGRPGSPVRSVARTAGERSAVGSPLAVTW
jgi:hypothetical protein